jgi:hypothetical protein
LLLKHEENTKYNNLGHEHSRGMQASLGAKMQMYDANPDFSQI